MCFFDSKCLGMIGAQLFCFLMFMLPIVAEKTLGWSIGVCLLLMNIQT